MVFPQCGSSSTAPELYGALRNVGFCGERRSGEPVAEPSEQGREPPPSKKKIGPHMTPIPGIEPGPHWFKASALTTAPSLRPKYVDQNKVLADVTGFCSMKRLGVFALSPGWVASPSQDYPQQ